MQRTVLRTAKVFLFVRPSVRPSVCKRMHCHKVKENCAHILIPYERTFILVFRNEKFLVADDLCTWNFWPNWPRSSKNADVQSISVAPQP